MIILKNCNRAAHFLRAYNGLSLNLLWPSKYSSPHNALDNDFIQSCRWLSTATSSPSASPSAAASAWNQCGSHNVSKPQTDSDSHHTDMPCFDMENPYEKPPKRCLLCIHDIQPDYKNVQLLSQFVSPHTGRIYDSSITGLCIPMHRRIQKLIRRSRVFGFMPFLIKDPAFLDEPRLFDPFRPPRPTLN